MPKRRKGQGKGSAYEREICSYLSLWFSNGEDDNWFWRSSQSGGRATIRARQGKSGANQAGDIAAIDPRAQPLMDLVTIEVKKGYAKDTFQDLFDKQPNAAQQTWERWIEQASTAARVNGTSLWWLITKRDRREALITFPYSFFKILKAQPHKVGKPLAYFSCSLKIENILTNIDFVVCHMDEFFDYEPKMVLECCKDYALKTSRRTKA
jgi:hypothetical protein